MRYFFFFLFLVLFPKFSKAQDFSLNQGGTNQENYFSVIKFENFYGFIIVSVTIKGENYRFLLDTGAPNCVSKALQQKLNYKILQKIPVSDSNGVTDSMTVLSMDELIFGGVTFNNTPALILDNPVFIDCMKIDGFIGSNMLRNSIVRFSYANSSITLTDNINKLNLSEKYASEMTLDSFQSNPYIDINIIGEEEGQEKLLFDTGLKGFYVLSDRNYQLFKEYPIFNIEA
jgi:Aspartyl protease